MSFAVSLRGGGLEYAGTDLAGLFAQRRNLVRPRFWAMLRDLMRFYREAEADALRLDPDTTLGAYLAARGYGAAFAHDHLLPMAAAIWSAPAERIAAYPALAFIRFCENHGLLLLRDRPQWRTVIGGSREYVRRLTAPYAAAIRLDCPVRAIRRLPGGVVLRAADGEEVRYDHVVIATHADQARALLADPSGGGGRAAGRGRQHPQRGRDAPRPALMPRRRRVWASWNYIGGGLGRRALRHLLDEPAAAHPRRRAGVRDAEPGAPAGAGDRAAPRPFRSSAVRCRGDARPARPVVAAGAAPHLVLRRLVRRRLP